MTDIIQSHATWYVQQLEEQITVTVLQLHFCK